MLLLPPQTNARFALVLMLTLCVLTMMGCACNSTPSIAPTVVEAPKIPAPPPTLEPTPSESYLLRAQRNTQKWQERLKGILSTP